MPKRSLGVREIRFRTANVPEGKAESFAPSDIEGQNLLEIFERWCEGLCGSTHVRKEAEECVLVKRVQRLDAETLLVDTLSGKMGPMSITTLVTCSLRLTRRRRAHVQAHAALLRH